MAHVSKSTCQQTLKNDISISSSKPISISLLSLAAGLKGAHSLGLFQLKTVYCDAEPLLYQHKSIFVKEAITKDKVFNAVVVRTKNNSIARDIWELVKPDLPLLFLIILTAVGAAIVQLQTPLVTGQLINILSSSVQAAADGLGALTIRDLNAPALKLFSLLTAQGVLTFAHISLVSAFGENVAKRLRAKLFAAIIQQDISFFDSHRSGELVSRLTADVAEFKVTLKVQFFEQLY